ncbi:MAG TPA: dTDP-4-dehydrorhamnose 3,5-epimerase [Candidatus Saccharimonadales bacterium]|nr:dTDP-4-dehydrorhamnose 3,5-epimerase [Candidatus Saccharimonadales bacterium]
MEFVETSLKGAYTIKPKVFQDERGFFLETYSKKVFAEHGIEADFVQDNHSLSVKKGVLRGLHFQLPPNDQAKLVRVTRGKVYDVIVDIRKNSPTYGKWEGFEISGDNFQMLFIPRGFAHAFLTLEDNTEFMYKVDNFYAPESDSGIIWNDPDLKIDWPIENPVLSDKDTKLQKFKDFNSPFKL